MIAVGVARPAVAHSLKDLEDELFRREAFVEIDHPVTGPRMYLANTGFRVSGWEPRDEVRSPLIGEHTDEVLRDWLAMEDTEIAALRATRAIGY